MNNAIRNLKNRNLFAKYIKKSSLELIGIVVLVIIGGLFLSVYSINKVDANIKIFGYLVLLLFAPIQSFLIISSNYKELIANYDNDKLDNMIENILQEINEPNSGFRMEVTAEKINKLPFHKQKQLLKMLAYIDDHLIK
ncbi:hypothetical protein EBB07_28250 [Paenibacillaceae bacterium]|nr:hypothetical protein EBB07_28250 [Paenibacillaceae bacterium]